MMKASAPGRRQVKKQLFWQHVNPLSESYQTPADLDEDWLHSNFQYPQKPFYIDLGCSEGGFCLQMAQHNPMINFLGLEIKPSLVTAANRMKEEKGLRNVYFIAANANVDIKRIMKDINQISLTQRVCIQFPDPHIKRKHMKRRMVTKRLISEISSELKDEGEIFTQCDLKLVAEYMHEILRSEETLVNAREMNLRLPGASDDGQKDDWFLNTSFHSVPTERETFVRTTSSRGRKKVIYKSLFCKKAPFLLIGDDSAEEYHYNNIKLAGSSKQEECGNDGKNVCNIFCLLS